MHVGDYVLEVAGQPVVPGDSPQRVAALISALAQSEGADVGTSGVGTSGDVGTSAGSAPR